MIRFSFSSRSLLFLSAWLAALPALAQNPSAEPPPVVTVASLVSDILAQNPELKFYEAEIAAAKAMTRSAASLDAPELSLELGRKRVKDTSGILRGEGETWSVSLSQAFPWPGRLALRKAIANRDVALAELGFARFQNALAARARTLAYGLHAAQVKAAAVREVADRFATLRETFLARDPAGVTPLLETRVIEASELALQRRAAAAELSLQAALVELNQLRGVPAARPLHVKTVALTFPDLPAAESLVTAALENNFDYKIRQVELEQQGLVVRLARQERLPNLSIGPFVSRENAGDQETVIGLGLSMPLPVGSRSRSASENAEARRRQAEAALLGAQRELEREIVIAAHAFTTTVAETRRWQPDSAQRFREAAELADRHYRLGAVPIATYVEMQNSYLDAIEALLETERETLEAGLKLQQLTGLNLNPAGVAP